jgi:uncharacterized iron-regulated membrane protein
MRNAALKIHLYTSLAAAIVLVVVGVTGCLLVFELQMDRWLDPSVSYVAGGPAVPLVRLKAAASEAAPGQTVLNFDFGPEGTTVMAKMSGGSRVYLDPSSARVVGVLQGEPPSYWVRHVHRELVGGPVGAFIVRVAAMLVVVQCLTGLYLWWPLKRVRVRFDASLRRVSFDLHNSIGFLSSLLLMIVAVTGVVKGYGDALQPFFDRITGSPAGVRALLSKPGPATASIDAAWQTARAALPGAAVGRITLPRTATASYLITMKYPGDSTVPGRSWVVVDRYSGGVLGRQDARSAPAGAQIPILNRAIHVGGIWGVPTRILAFLTSLAMLMQLGTGLVLWRKRATATARVDREVREPEAASSTLP